METRNDYYFFVPHDTMRGESRRDNRFFRTWCSSVCHPCVCALAYVGVLTMLVRPMYFGGREYVFVWCGVSLNDLEKST